MNIVNFKVLVENEAIIYQIVRFAMERESKDPSLKKSLYSK